MIQNCFQCSDGRTCTACFAGYFPITQIDTDGTPFTTCIWNFCGLDSAQKGLTNNCFQCAQLSNCYTCALLNSITSASSQHQSCTRCAPGYIV